MAREGTKSDVNEGQAHPLTCTVQHRSLHGPIKINENKRMESPPYGSSQEEWTKTYTSSSFSINLRSSLFKTNVSKLQNHGHGHCPVDFVCDVMNTSGKYGMGAHYIKNQPSSALRW